MNMDEETKRRFDAELLWCCDQLQSSLESGTLPEKRAREAMKTLKSLQNPKGTLIKKRQLMRTTFGDYRAKMEAEEKKFRLDATVKPSATVPKASLFYKKSAPPSTTNSSDNGFRFNFSADPTAEAVTVSAPIIDGAASCADDEMTEAPSKGGYEYFCDTAKFSRQALSSSSGPFKFNFANPS